MRRFLGRLGCSFFGRVRFSSVCLSPYPVRGLAGCVFSCRSAKGGSRPRSAWPTAGQRKQLQKQTHKERQRELSAHACTYVSGHVDTCTKAYICTGVCRLLVVNSLASQVIDVVRTRHAIEREQISVTYTAIMARGFVACVVVGF